MALRPERAAAWQRGARRAADILIAGSALFILAPPMIAIAVVIRLTSPGPALFKQRRAGLEKRPFWCFKFRTMRAGGDDAPLRDLVARQLRGEDTSAGGSWKLDGDSRVTKFGAWLRRTSLDELPQLLNVLRGDMALVGPRPMPVWEVEMYPSEFDERFDVRPGITGLWQVSGRSTVGTLGMLELDVRYTRQRSFAGDIAILARTLPVLFRGDGAR